MAVILILLGSAVGLVGSVLGSIIVGRRELTRRARIRIYQDLLPPLVKAAERGPYLPAVIETDRVHDLYREGVLAGSRERQLALRTLDAWKQAMERPLETVTDDEGSWRPTSADLLKTDQTKEALRHVLVEFESYLEHKIR